MGVPSCTSVNNIGQINSTEQNCLCAFNALRSPALILLKLEETRGKKLTATSYQQKCGAQREKLFREADFTQELGVGTHPPGKICLGINVFMNIDLLDICNKTSSLEQRFCQNKIWCGYLLCQRNGCSNISPPRRIIYAVRNGKRWRRLPQDSFRQIINMLGLEQAYNKKPSSLERGF